MVLKQNVVGLGWKGFVEGVDFQGGKVHPCGPHYLEAGEGGRGGGAMSLSRVWGLGCREGKVYMLHTNLEKPPAGV